MFILQLALRVLLSVANLKISTYPTGKGQSCNKYFYALTCSVHVGHTRHNPTNF